MTNAAELVLQRRQTMAMIGAAPLTVKLRRRTLTRNDRGGLDDGGVIELPEQTFRILHAPPRRRRLENNPPDESIVEYPYAKDYLMGRWDADIKKDDEFDAEGVIHKVTYVFIYRDYEIIANIETLDQI